MNTLKTMAILVVLFMSLLLFAQGNAESSSSTSGSVTLVNTSTTSLKTEDKPKAQKTFGITVSLIGSSNFYKEGALDREASTDLDMIPVVNFTDKLSLSNRTIVSKQHTGARNTTVTNSKFTLIYLGPELGRDTGTYFTTVGTAPTNEEDREQNSFRGAFGLGAAINTKAVKSLDATYRLTATRNFHEFTVNAEGEPNVRQTLTHELLLSYEFIPKWTLDFSGAYKNGWTYKDFQRSSYANEIGIGHQVTESWSLSASVSNEGSAFKSNGTDSNIKFYDQNTTVFNAAVTFTN